jgi:hypothetical protein
VLVGQPGDIVVAPVSATAKRVDAGTPRFFEQFADFVAERIAAVRIEHLEGRSADDFDPPVTPP